MHSENAAQFSAPIPTKFLLSDEFAVLNEATRDTGFSRSEIIRRAVRLLKRQKAALGNYRFVVDLTPAT
jgi:hypothetical protein